MMVLIGARAMPKPDLVKQTIYITEAQADAMDAVKEALGVPVSRQVRAGIELALAKYVRLVESMGDDGSKGKRRGGLSR